MNGYKSYISTIISVIVLVLIISVLFSVFFDRPALVSYVLSNSMEPTFKAGDIIFINPFVFNLEINDIIVFKSGKDYVVHRIVGVTEEGFITKGDNNIATDQLNGKPYVQTRDIAGKTLALAGRHIVIPGGGIYMKGGSDVLGKNKIAVIALLVIIGLYFTVDSGDRRPRKKRSRSILKISFSVIYFIFSLIILVIIALSMVMVTETRYIEYSTTVAIGSNNPDWYAPGAVFQKELDIHNYGRYPYYYKLETISPYIEVAEDAVFLLSPGESKKVMATIHAPTETRLNAEKYIMWEYLPLLPLPAVELLFSINPYLPSIMIDMLFAVLLVVVYFIIGGSNERPIRLARNRSLARLESELRAKINMIRG